MKTRLLFLLASLCLLTSAIAQSPGFYSSLQLAKQTSAYYDVSEKSTIRFNTDITTPQQRAQANQDRLNTLAAQNPDYATQRNAYEVAIQQVLANQNQNPFSTQAVITIPVVVHVVYNTAAQNIPTNQVLSQIQVLNEDFGRTNADTNAHWSQAANTTIQFCLAQQDPSGVASTGIERRSTTVTSFSSNDAVKHFSQGGLDIWDPTRYLNIWVCNLGGGLLGYGEFPTASTSNTFGVVILYSAFGSNYTAYGSFPTITSPYDRGRTTTHEFSHCFNLYHIWGDDGGACSGSDLCADTPNQADATTTCYTFPHTDACTTTNPGIMFENYMDYSYDNCMNLFTQNQKSRMLAVLSTAPYNALATSTACLSPANSPPTALFAASATSVCPGTPISFTDQSIGNPTSWSWTFPSATPASSSAQNPSNIVWNTAGTYTVTLVASNANGTSTYTLTVTVIGTVSPPLVEGFEGATFPPSGWTNYDAGSNGVVWLRYNIGHNSSWSAKFDNYNNDVAGQRDELRTPRIDFSSAATVTMTFDVAHRRYSTSTTTDDSLQVVVSTDCGATWTSVYLKGGATLASVTGTQTTAFTPTNTQWRTETVNLNTYAGQGGVIIAFRNRGHYGNNIYVDNVNITTTASTIPNAVFTASAATVCAGTAVSFTDNSSNAPTSWSWTFPSGTPASATTQNVTSVVWNTAGTYTVTHTATNASGTGTYTMVITVNALPTITTTTTGGTICSGSSTSITASGGTSYSWMPGSLSGTTVTVSPTTTTTYTVTGTNANGCSNTATRTITVNPSPTVATTTTGGTICSGSSTSMTASGASSYTWMPGSLTGATVTVSPATTTTYTVTGTAANGCTGTATRTITVNPSPTVTVTTTAATICAGSSTSITASGATSYAWMPGSLTGATVTVSPAATTTYTVTGTAANGCTAPATQIITVNPLPTVSTTTTGGTICSGGSTSITASGATSYTWMPGSLSGTTVTVSPTTTTTYTVTGTNANGCSNTATRTITVNASPTVTTTTSGATICSGGSTTITAAGASTYTWMPGSLTGTTVTVSPTTTTTYTVTGTAANGCNGTATRTITVNPTPTVTTTTTAGTICSGSSTSITASGATTYTWMPGSLSGATVTVSPTSTTTYTVTGTSGGCNGTATRVITVNPTPTVTTTTSGATICSGSSTTITASGAASYAWMPGSLSGTSVTVSPATTTTYTVTGTAANGCSNTATRTITVNPSPTVAAAASSTSICTGNNVTLTGSGAASYTWNPGALSGSSVTVTPAATTTYTVTGTAANGCTGTQTLTITVGSQPTVTASSSSSAVCTGSNATLTGSGAATYTWMPGSLSGSSVSVSPATTTTYTVTGVVTAGCQNTATVTVTVNPLPNVTAAASASTICDGSSATLSASGALTYNWMPGSLSGSSVSVSPNTTTTYTVTGTDANGCPNTTTQTITVNALPVVSATSSANAVCAGSPVTLNAAGAATYDWQPGSLSGASVTDVPVSSTTYTLTGTDANGCTDTTTLAVTVNPLPVVSASASSASVCAGSTVTLSASGANTFNWQPVNLAGSTISDAPAATTTYVATGTDANGCSAADSVTVTVHALPNLAVSADTTVCEGSSVTLSASGASTYDWQPGSLSGTPVMVTPVSTTTYTVTGTDANGCSNTSFVTVTTNTPPTAPAIIVNGSTLTSSVTGASYQWFLNGLPITGATGQSYTATQTGTYTVEVYDALGCGSGQSSGVVDPTGVASTEAVQSIVLLPNPSEGRFELRFTVNTPENFVLEIHNALGQVVYHEELGNFSGTYDHEIDLREFGKGLYTIRLISPKQETVIRAVTY